MSTEDFVTYEQALSIKKLGFREKCYQFYDNVGTPLCDNYLRCFNYDGIITSSSLFKSNNSSEEFCDAPTLEQVQKWLRNEKKLSIEPVSGDTDEHGWEYGLVDRTNEYPLFNFNNVTYSSYEEALSAGIIECIKLLENISGNI